MEDRLEGKEASAREGAGSPAARQLQAELERRLHHLRTLHDLGGEIFGSRDPETILRNFLLMTAGNFGAGTGFVLTRSAGEGGEVLFAPLGIEVEDAGRLKEKAAEALGGIQHAAAEAVECLDEGLRTRVPWVQCAFAFRVESNWRGLLALGPRLTAETYDDADRELLGTLLNSLAAALRNARAFRDINRLNERLQDRNRQMQGVLEDLDRRVYHLRTLHDVSSEIFGSVEIDAILKSFLLMTLGNFGVVEGFVLTLDPKSGTVTRFTATGYGEGSLPALQTEGKRLLERVAKEGVPAEGPAVLEPEDLPAGVSLAVPLGVRDDSLGLLGLGAKITGQPWGEADRELLATLANNLAVSLRNALSFQEILALNRDLRAALRKVELLESIKANLCKFVPAAVSSLIEKSPTAAIPEAREQDVSVLFLDIEGYTRLSEKLSGTELNALVERYFSVFIDAIHENNGDVNETAGDGLMVLFMDRDAEQNALQAVKAALTIRDRAAQISREDRGLPEPLRVNMGINSGAALVGAARFESYTGSRWTYTARGMVTNLAARMGALASGGRVYLSHTTALRVKDRFGLEPLGAFHLRNVSEPMEIFALT